LEKSPVLAHSVRTFPAYMPVLHAWQIPPPVMGSMILAASPTRMMLSSIAESSPGQVETNPPMISRICPFLNLGSLAMNLSRYILASALPLQSWPATPIPTLATPLPLGKIQTYPPGATDPMTNSQ